MRAMTVRLRRIRATTAVACAVAAAACTSSSTAPLRSVSGIAQGTTYSLQWAGGAPEPEIAVAAEQELARIDALLSNYRPDSTLERFNAADTTEPLELPGELVALLELAKRVHRASDGCVDPTVRPLVHAWGFDGDSPALPAPEVIDAARAAVGLDKLELTDAAHARKAVPALALDMASIGQGYTAGRLADLLERSGSTAYLAEIGGEVVARGLKPDASPWRIGIENPIAGAGPALRMPPAARTAVITSGSYRHYFEADGRHFGHIIDPRSGWPVEHALVSVTVVGSDAAAAAAWGTALLCLGPPAAATAAEREGVAALFWTAHDGDAMLEQSPAFASEWSELLEQRGR
ncbi:MAG TPA: FAD:protein FMN transferase [Gammaproteobacteria bacterium]